jgi:hypothetical protein
LSFWSTRPRTVQIANRFGVHRTQLDPIEVYRRPRGNTMTLCPIALAVHCTGCPIVKACPAKRSIGDFGTYVPPAAATPVEDTTQRSDTAR